MSASSWKSTVADASTRDAAGAVPGGGSGGVAAVVKGAILRDRPRGPPWTAIRRSPVRDRAVGPSEQPGRLAVFRELAHQLRPASVELHAESRPLVGPQLAVPKVAVLRQVRLGPGRLAQDLHAHRPRERGEDVDERRRGHRSGEMRDEPYVVGLAQRGLLAQLRDASRIGKRHARVIDQVLLDQLVHVPAIAEVLAHGDRHSHLGAQALVDGRLLGAHQILDEEGLEVLDQVAQSNCVGHVETGVEVDGPVAVGGDALVQLLAQLMGAPHHHARVEAVAAGVGAVRPVRLEPGLDAGAGRLPGRATIRERGRVAGDVLAGETAEELVRRDTQGLAPDVPERQVERTLGMQLLAARRIEVATVHELPEVFYSRRVLSDQQARELLESVAGAALADARETLVGLDRHDGVALVEGWAGLRRLIEADARDLQPRYPGRRGGLATPAVDEHRTGRAQERAEELPLPHAASVANPERRHCTLRPSGFRVSELTAWRQRQPDPATGFGGRLWSLRGPSAFSRAAEEGLAHRPDRH